MRLNITKRRAVDAALKKVNRLGFLFCITSWEEIHHASKLADRMMDQSNISKRDRQGAIVIYRRAGPEGFQGEVGVQSTKITLERGTAERWFLTQIKQDHVEPGDPEYIRILLGRDEVKKPMPSPLRAGNTTKKRTLNR